MKDVEVNTILGVDTRRPIDSDSVPDDPNQCDDRLGKIHGSLEQPINGRQFGI